MFMPTSARDVILGDENALRCISVTSTSVYSLAYSKSELDDFVLLQPRYSVWWKKSLLRMLACAIS